MELNPPISVSKPDMPTGESNSEWLMDSHHDEYLIGLRIKDRLFREQSPFQLVEVFETEGFGRLLTLDGIIMLTERDEFVYHDMLTHLPLCAHPNPRNILIIGGGDGGTLREVLKHPSVQRADLVEIDEMVIRVSREFLPALSVGFDDARTRIFCEDGSRFVREHPNSYDVVLVDSTDPVGPAVGLFEEPFFRSVSECLRPDGVLTLQSESPFFDGDIVRSVVQRLRGIFPHVRLYLAPVVTYPGGHWSFSFAGKAFGPLDGPYADHFSKRGLETRFYTPGIHLASLQLPRFVKDILK